MAQQKKKRGCFSRLVRTAAILFGIILVIGIIGGGSDTDQQPSQTATQRPAVTATQVPSPTNTPNPTQPPDESSTGNVETFMELLRTQLSDSGYSFYDVKLEDDIVVVSVALDGLALEVALTKESNITDNYETWENSKASVLEYGKSIDSLMDAFGLDNLYMLNVLNDQNHELLLLSIAENVIFYDVLAE